MDNFKIAKGFYFGHKMITGSETLTYRMSHKTSPSDTMEKFTSTVVYMIDLVIDY